MTKRSADTEYIRDEAGLLSLCERLREHDRLAVDTEFMGEDSFHPRLEIIQVAAGDVIADRKSTRLNSSHLVISYAVFCLKKKKHTSELQSLAYLVCRLLLERKKLSSFN